MSSIKEKQNRPEKWQILSRPTPKTLSNCRIARFYVVFSIIILATIRYIYHYDDVRQHLT